MDKGRIPWKNPRDKSNERVEKVRFNNGRCWEEKTTQNSANNYPDSA